MLSSKFIDGTALQIVASLTLGQPFEVWKTRMGRHRTESTLESFGQIYRSGGLGGFWKGVGPKLFESATKGGVLLVAKDAVQESLRKVGVSQTTSGFIGGAVGGVAQTAVIGPSTFLGTAMVLGKQGCTISSIMAKTWSEKGFFGFYQGGSAIALRQASNWASRQGFTEAARSRIAQAAHGDARAKLSTREEVAAGVLGGALSCWNHPFEVARIEMQARAIMGEQQLSTLQVIRHINAEHGVRGLFQGLLPRMGLNIWLTLFMVSGVKLLKEAREADFTIPLVTRPRLSLRPTLTSG
ncbi:hypothetical protein AB1Y20_015195 [Prymnesium parvum]|uniref:Mitochondrial carrier protein n=1 Tax=Prymnesium parvum TaxID=97485 RepID=A0AB34JX44_PRYPA